jgi:serine/threonine-protein kinase
MRPADNPGPLRARGGTLRIRRAHADPDTNELSLRSPRAQTWPPDAMQRELEPGPSRSAGPSERIVMGNYLLDPTPIGAGSSGTVYRARHRELGSPVAVKVLHASQQLDRVFVRRFQREALAASKLDHPNVLRVLDFGEDSGGRLYIVMELVEGRTLQEALGEGGAQPTNRVVDVMMQVCAGLAVAHDRGIVHRDVKPANVMLSATFDDDGNAVELAKVCDFGVAHDAARNPEDTQTGTGGILPGTPQYVSPEQARFVEPDPRSDVYSCGVVLYEMATGKLPFVADSAVGVLMQHISIDPLNPRRVNFMVDPPMEQIILRCLRKDPNERFQSARDLRSALKSLKT